MICGELIIDYDFQRGVFSCVSHDFELDDTGHSCRRCGLREEIIHGQKFIIDPRMPENEIRLTLAGVTVGRVNAIP